MCQYTALMGERVGYSAKIFCDSTTLLVIDMSRVEKLAKTSWELEDALLNAMQAMNPRRGEGIPKLDYQVIRWT